MHILIRYYKAEDVIKESGVSAEDAESLGDNEVFKTNFTSKIYADLLNGKCNVWTVEEYDGRGGLGENDFYSRAKYDMKAV